MAEVSSISDQAAPGLRIQTTQPEQILRHNISDEELEMLGDTRHVFSWDVLWVAVGGLVGSAPAALTALFAYNSEGSHGRVAGADLIQIVIFFCCIVVGLIMLIISLRYGNNARDLKSEIRSRRGSQPGHLDKV